MEIQGQLTVQYLTVKNKNLIYTFPLLMMKHVREVGKDCWGRWDGIKSIEVYTSWCASERCILGRKG